MNYTYETIPNWLVDWALSKMRRQGQVIRGDYVEAAVYFCAGTFSGWHQDDIRQLVRMEQSSRKRHREEVEQSIIDSYADGETPSMASVARRVGCSQSVVRRVVQQAFGDLPEVTGEDGKAYRFSTTKAILAADRKMESTAKSQVRHVLRRAELAPAAVAVDCADSVDRFRNAHRRWRKQS